jgi:hypothetical protein
MNFFKNKRGGTKKVSKIKPIIKESTASAIKVTSTKTSPTTKNASKWKIAKYPANLSRLLAKSKGVKEKRSLLCRQFPPKKQQNRPESVSPWPKTL